MIVCIDKSFEKEVDQITNKKLLIRIALLIEEIQQANSLHEVK
jgi:hypothetical protein